MESRLVVLLVFCLGLVNGTVPGYQYGTGLGNYGLGRPAGYQYGTGLGTGLGNYGLGRPAGYQYGTGLGTGLGNYGLGRPAGYQYGTGLGNYGLGTPAGYRQITGPSYYSLGSAGFAAPVGFGQSSYGPVGSQFGWGAAPAGVLGSPFVGGQTAHFGAIGPGGLGAGGRVLSNIYAGSTTGTSGHAFGGSARAFARDGSIAVALGGSGVGASGVGNTIGTGIGTGITRGDMRASYFGDSYYGPGSLGVGSGKKGKKGGAAYSGLRSGYYSGGSVFGAGLGNVFPGPAWNPRMTPFGLGGGGRVFSNYYAGPTIGRSGMAFGGPANAVARGGSAAYAFGGTAVPGSGAGHTIMTGVGTGTQSGRMRAAYGGDIYSGTSPYSYGTLYGASPVVGSGRPLSQGASWSSTALPAFPWSNGAVLGNGGALGAGSTGVLGIGNRLLNGLGIPSAGVGGYSGGVLGSYGTSGVLGNYGAAGVLGSYGTGDPWLSGGGPSLVGSGLAGPNVGNVVIGGGGPGYLGSGLISPRVGNVVVGGAPGVGLYNAGVAGYSNVGMLGSGKKG